MIRSLLALVLLGGIGLAKEPASRPSAPLELVVLQKDRISLAHLHVEVNGKPLSAIWDETFAQLFRFVDRDGNGALGDAEVKLLPAPVAIRQALGNGFIPPVDNAPSLREIDENNDRKVTLAELTSFYRKAGLGNAVIGVGRLRASSSLTDALLKSIDTNGDGTTTEKEWKAAEQILGKLDKNGDKLIGAGELVPKAIYPGVMGSRLLQSPKAGRATSTIITDLPLLLLPMDSKDTFWASVILQRRDHDRDGKLSSAEAGLSAAVFKQLDRDKSGTLTTTELSPWRQGKADLNWIIRLGKQAKDGTAFTYRDSGLQIENWINEGRITKALESATASVLGQVGTSTQPKGKRSSSRNSLDWLLPFADRDRNGKLEPKELEAWLKLQEQLAEGQVLLTLLSDGGLFELLDVNHNGALSLPELRGAWKRLAEAGCTQKKTLQPSLIPQILLAPVSRGYLDTFGAQTAQGPEWFQGMDRNRDGVLTVGEFIGDRKKFDALDKNRDGWIDVEEAKSFSP